jgi:hypothetical protein
LKGEIKMDKKVKTAGIVALLMAGSFVAGFRFCNGIWYSVIDGYKRPKHPVSYNSYMRRVK